MGLAVRGAVYAPIQEFSTLAQGLIDISHGNGTMPKFSLPCKSSSSISVDPDQTVCDYLCPSHSLLSGFSPDLTLAESFLSNPRCRL